MSKKYRIILLTCTFVLLQLVGFIIEGSFINLLSSFWYTSGFVLLILLSLVDQPFFSKDSNIFMNAITAIMALLLIKEENRDYVFYFFVIYTFYLLISSYFLMVRRSKSLKEEGKVIQFISRFNRIIGKPDVIFSVFFIWGAMIQYTTSSTQFNTLLLFWTLFMLLNLPELSRAIEKLFEKSLPKSEGIGRIFGVQSQNTFLVKVDSKYKQVDLFSFVEMKYSVDNKVYRGFICEMMLLDQEQWIKVITNEDINLLFSDSDNLANYLNDVVYKIENIPTIDIFNKFVGVVTEGTEINKIRFLYNSKVIINEGTIVEIKINNKNVVYQIIKGRTMIEQLANKNQSGYIMGEAIQLGAWDFSKSRFEKFGWVPIINTPIYLATPLEQVDVEDNEIIIGSLPETNYPVILNKEIAITHHTAIIGVTGTGKSVFSRNLIREFIKEEDTKVICIDFTGEYKEKFNDLNLVNIINETDSQVIFEDIKILEIEEAKFANLRNNVVINESKSRIHTLITTSIENFLRNNEKITVFELPEVHNTSGVMYYTMAFIRTLFQIAKNNNSYGKKISLVLEEAHTIIPEWNFAGSSDKNTQAVNNSIAQIALQGRKYNIGLLVIAQRTANVSKTILTQCNTIISFQEFDKTSIDYLANYFGNDIAESANKLKFRQAIAAGKALKSNVPMIFEVPEIIEVESVPNLLDLTEAAATN
ncbi:MAG: ATP-binding protein [Paenisporosarcina sp.]